MSEQQINGGATVETIADAVSTDNGEGRRTGVDFGILKQVPMTVTVEVGRATMTLGEILDGAVTGSMIRLDRHPGDAVEVYVNGALYARAEVVIANEQIAARIIELAESEDSSRGSGLLAR